MLRNKFVIVFLPILAHFLCFPPGLWADPGSESPPVVAVHGGGSGGIGALGTASTTGNWTSTATHPVEKSPYPSIYGDRATMTVIDFGTTLGLPNGTVVTNQYLPYGVIFSGKSGPAHIRNDGASSTNPVLAGTPDGHPFEGPIGARFVNPSTGEPLLVSNVGALVGHFGATYSTCLNGYDVDGDWVAGYCNIENDGFQFLTITTRYPQIASVVFHPDTADPAGFAIDMFHFDAMIDPGTNGDVDDSALDKDPVNTFTGELVMFEPPDLALSEGPIEVRFSRYYCSGLDQEQAPGFLGSNWRHNYDWTIAVDGDVATVTTDTGKTIEFLRFGGRWSLGNDVSTLYTLEETGQGYYLFYDPDSQLGYGFYDGTLKLSYIIDRSNNLLLLTYTGDQLTRVTDGLGRTLWFTYYGFGRLQTVSDGTRSVVFFYNGTDLGGVQDARGNMTTYSYAPGGLLTTKTRPEGNAPYTQTYHPDNRVASQADAEGNTSLFEFNELETVLTDPLSNVRRHHYSANGELIGIEDEAANTVALEVDSVGRRSGLTDRYGDQTSLDYDRDSGKIATITGADGETTSFTYATTKYSDLREVRYPDGSDVDFYNEASGNPYRVYDRLNARWDYQYNSRGQVTEITNPLLGQTTLTYYPDATVADITDASGNATTRTYDGLKRLTGILHADGSSETMSYDENDNVLSATDEMGFAEVFTYDRNNNLVTSTDRMGATTTLTYDGMDRTVAVTDPEGGVLSFDYDELGRLRSITDQNQNTTAYGYDARGRQTTITDSGGRVWSRGYDDEGVLTATTNPMSQTISYVSDAMGRLIEATTELGFTTRTSYDEMGRVAAVEDPLGRVTQYGYNGKGQLTSVVMPESVDVSVLRNGMGGITRVTDGRNRYWRSEYDAHGRLTSRIDANGVATTFGYDSRNRVNHIDYPDHSVDLFYDPVGNLRRKIYSDGTDLSFDYDGERRTVAADGLTLSYDGNGEIVLSNGIGIARDPGGRVQAIVFSIGKVVVYSYNPRGALATVTDWFGNQTVFHYDDAGRRTSTIRSNGITALFQYDADGRLVGITESGLSSISLDRDGAGQIVSATRSHQIQPNLSIDGDQFSFDSACQVNAYTYDGQGNLVSDGTRSYVWDDAGRLNSVSDSGGTIQYDYDGLGNRIGRTEAGASRTYVWNLGLGMPSIAIEKENGSDLRYFVHSPDGVLLYSIDAVTGGLHHYHFDERGNTTYVTDGGGSVVAAYAYGPYGESLGASGTIDNPFRWAGEYGVMDDGNGLHYMRARYYDSRSARFISRDPLASLDPRAINPYQFAKGNPLTYLDPLGLDPFEDIKWWVETALTVSSGGLIVAVAKGWITAAAAAVAAEVVAAAALWVAAGWMWYENYQYFDSHFANREIIQYNEWWDQTVRDMIPLEKKIRSLRTGIRGLQKKLDGWKASDPDAYRRHAKDARDVLRKAKANLAEAELEHMKAEVRLQWLQRQIQESSERLDPDARPPWVLRGRSW